mgnify:FL=1
MPARLLFAAAVLLLLSTACGGASQEDGPGNASDSLAGTAPGTDIYLASLERVGDTLRLGPPQNVTQRPGYDNQPAFARGGGAIVYTAVREGQTDVVRYALDADARRTLTDTPQSEYSPTPRPDDRMTLVRVEDDGRQRLWQYSAFGLPAAPVFADRDAIGYHAWLDSARVALFVLGEPPALHLANSRTDSAAVITEGIGRSLQPIPNATAISFVAVAPDSTTAIHRLDLDGTTRRLTDPPASGRGVDHAWMPDGTLLMAEGTLLYAWTPAHDGWRAVANVAPLEPSRLAVSPDGRTLALVAQDTPPQ